MASTCSSSGEGEAFHDGRAEPTQSTLIKNGEAYSRNGSEPFFGCRMETFSCSRLNLRTGDDGKFLVAVLIRRYRSAVKRWLAHRLAMGHTGNVNQLIGAFRKDMANREKLSELQNVELRPPKT